MNQVPCSYSCLCVSLPLTPLGTLYYSSRFFFLSFFELFVLSLARPVLVPETKEVVSHKYKTPMVSHLLCLWVLSQGIEFLWCSLLGLWAFKWFSSIPLAPMTLPYSIDKFCGKVCLWSVSAWREQIFKDSDKSVKAFPQSALFPTVVGSKLPEKLLLRTGCVAAGEGGGEGNQSNGYLHSRMNENAWFVGKWYLRMLANIF